MMLTAVSCGSVSGSSESVTSAAGKESTMETETKLTDSNNADSELPKEAKEALLAYLSCDTYEKLADSILPTSAAEEAKNGKPIIGNYYFGFGPTNAENVSDIKILECTRLPADQAERLGAFWSAGVNIQGFEADFTGEDGYDTVLSAVVSIDSDHEGAEIPKVRFTARLEVLKVKDDRWIVIPSSDTETNGMEPVV